MHEDVRRKPLFRRAPWPWVSKNDMRNLGGVTEECSQRRLNPSDSRKECLGDVGYFHGCRHSACNLNAC